MTPASPHHDQGGRQGSHNFTRLVMAKKAKRRGRPPGAKSPDKMDIGQLRQYIDRLEGILKKKVGEQRAFLEGKLSELSGFASAKAARMLRAVPGLEGTRKKGTRRKAEPKYRS